MIGEVIMNKEKLRKIISKSSFWMAMTAMVIGLTVLSTYETIPIKTGCTVVIIVAIFMLIYNLTATDNEKYLISTEHMKDTQNKEFLDITRKMQNKGKIVSLVLTIILCIIGIILG